MSYIAIIPARMGSKRLPKKNILPINGRPMLHYPVEALHASGLFDQVIVSTEDSLIAKIAREVNARVITRPRELARDEATMADVCSQVLDVLEQESASPACFCCVYATAVFLGSDDFQRSLARFDDVPGSEIVIGVSTFNIHPYRALQVNASGRLSPVWPKKMKAKEQQMPTLVGSNGTLCWARTSVFQRTKSFYGSHMVGYEIPPQRAIDIDTPEDYALAQMLAVDFFDGTPACPDQTSP